MKISCITKKFIFFFVFKNPANFTRTHETERSESDNTNFNPSFLSILNLNDNFFQNS